MTGRTSETEKMLGGAHYVAGDPDVACKRLRAGHVPR